MIKLIIVKKKPSDFCFPEYFFLVCHFILALAVLNDGSVNGSRDFLSLIELFIILILFFFHSIVNALKSVWRIRFCFYAHQGRIHLIKNTVKQ